MEVTCPSLLTRPRPEAIRGGEIPLGRRLRIRLRRGARRADTFLQQLQMGEKKYVLGWMVRDMMADRRLTGLEVGFFHRLSEYLALVPHNASLILHLSDRRKIGEGEPWMQPSSTSC